MEAYSGIQIVHVTVPLRTTSIQTIRKVIHRNVECKKINPVFSSTKKMDAKRKMNVTFHMNSQQMTKSTTKFPNFAGMDPGAGGSQCEDGEVIPPCEERMGFGRVDVRQPPPGYAVGSERQSQSQRTQSVPDRRNMIDFPGMKKPRHMMEIWV